MAYKHPTDDYIPQKWENIIFQAVLNVSHVLNDREAYGRAVAHLRCLLWARMEQDQKDYYASLGNDIQRFEYLIMIIDGAGYLPPARIEGVLDAESIERLHGNLDKD
jgi:hypothetical protein